MILWDSYLRWRHSKGFGVHSPYAYKFVTSVLKPGKYGYYAYDEINRFLPEQSRGNLSITMPAEFLIRLCIFLDTGRVVTSHLKDRAILSGPLALGISCREIGAGENFKFKKGDLLIVEGDAEEKLLKDAINEGIPVLALRPKQKLKMILTRPLDKGVLFEGNKNMLLIPRDEMEYVAYQIYL